MLLYRVYWPDLPAGNVMQRSDDVSNASSSDIIYGHKILRAESSAGFTHYRLAALCTNEYLSAVPLAPHN